MPAKRRDAVTGAELRNARLAQGLTQQEAAAFLDVTERTYRRWERGEVTRVRRSYLELLKQARRTRDRS